jgi:hypothetical protein
MLGDDLFKGFLKELFMIIHLSSKGLNVIV